MLCICNQTLKNKFVMCIAGDWKNHFSSEQLTRFTSVISKELEGESFPLPWSLD
uniref:Sulfotransferase n=1 Tax=Neolamprologus brichardi TaxID=32507 RepID=A0A3Q4H828_NEOBR